MTLSVRTILRARWLLVLGAALGGAGVGDLLDSRRPIGHTIYGQIQLPPVAPLKRTIHPELDAVESSEEAVPLVGSTRILNRIVTDLDLARSSQFLGFVPESHTAAQQNELRLFAVARLRARLLVRNVTGTSLARIEYVDPDPRLAGSIVNAAIDDYIADRYELRYASAHGKSLAMAAGMAELRQQVNDMQQQLLRLQQVLGAPGFTPRNNPYVATRADLERRSSAARLARLSAAAEAEALRANPASGAEESLPSPAGNQGARTNLRLSLYGTRSEQAGLQAVLGPHHPEMEAMEARNANLQAALDREYRRGVEIADARVELARDYENELASAVAAHKRNMVALQASFARYANLEREYVLTRRLYLTNFERLRTQEAAAALSQADVFIVDKAAEMPWTPPVPVWFATLSSGLLAMFLAFQVSSRLEIDRYPARRLARLEHLSGARVLATIPSVRQASMPRLTGLISGAAQAGSGSGAVEEFIQGIFDLRVQLEATVAGGPGGRGRCLLFTSALPSEGKTTVSSNVAVAMARHGMKVLLIDADLRRPAVHRHFGLSGAIGLTSVLKGKLSLEQAVQAIAGTDRLDVLASGPLPPDASSTLASDAMREMLRCAGKLYSTVIVDSPPLLATSDALALSQWMDATVWVIREGRAKRSALLHARGLLENYGTQPLGILVNGIGSTALPLSALRPDECVQG